MKKYLTVMVFGILVAGCATTSDRNLSERSPSAVTQASASSSTQCTTRECWSKYAATFISIPTPNWPGLTLDRKEAEFSCAKVGGHVPTAREWAQWAMGHGATGIAELPPGVTRDRATGRIPPVSYSSPLSFSNGGYVLIDATNSDNKPDIFYYSSRNYQPPPAGKDPFYFYT